MTNPFGKVFQSKYEWYVIHDVRYFARKFAFHEPTNYTFSFRHHLHTKSEEFIMGCYEFRRNRAQSKGNISVARISPKIGS